jgi:hypothetical protein
MYRQALVCSLVEAAQTSLSFQFLGWGAAPYIPSCGFDSHQDRMSGPQKAPTGRALVLSASTLAIHSEKVSAPTELRHTVGTK